MKVQRQIDELLALRASEWFEILKAPTEAERAAFVAWLGESRLHMQEFLEVAAVDDVVGDLRPELREDLDALVNRAKPAAVALRPRARPRPFDGRFARNAGRRRIAVWGAGLAVAAALALGVAALLGAPEFSTTVGEQRTIELADTSVVTLNVDSRIEVHMKEAEREIDLRRGEAIFKVAQDAKRPFRVRTRAGVIQAVGTQFNVYARPDGDTRVSVLEGRVRLMAGFGAGSRPAAQFLQAGEEAYIRLNGAIQRNPSAAVSNAVAWRERRLVFSDASIEDMVLEFNRYNQSLQFKLREVPPGTYRFAGIFDADDPESLADLLAREPDLMLERSGGEIVIRRR